MHLSDFLRFPECHSTIPRKKQLGAAFKNVISLKWASCCALWTLQYLLVATRGQTASMWENKWMEVRACMFLLDPCGHCNCNYTKQQMDPAMQPTAVFSSRWSVNNTGGRLNDNGWLTLIIAMQCATQSSSKCAISWLSSSVKWLPRSTELFEQLQKHWWCISWQGAMSLLESKLSVCVCVCVLKLCFYTTLWFLTGYLVWLWNSSLQDLQ